MAELPKELFNNAIKLKRGNRKGVAYMKGRHSI
jgi:hypothetical protein